MEEFDKFLDKSNYSSLVSVVNLVCEIAEKSKEKDKHTYAVNIFQRVTAELRAHGKISATLYQQCKNLSADDLDDAIVDTIAMWNKVVSVYQRLRRLLRKCRSN